MKIKPMQPSIKMINLHLGAAIAVPRIKGRHLSQIRQRILTRDGHKCRRCGHVSIHLEVDHIMPLHLGGAESDDNRQALCEACHRIKSDAEGRRRED